jgi:sister-chromatid-cohesion protein PDS5
VHTVIPSLADPSSTYNGQHLYVLKSLAEVKSIVLLADVPGTGPLVELLFKQCFDVLGGPTKSNSGEELSKNVEHHMTSVLSTVVEESQNLSPEVVETILAQFLRTSPKVASNGVGKKKGQQVEDSQATLTLKEAPPAYNMATNVCNSSPDKMGRYVTRYVNAILLEASSAIAESSTTVTMKKGGKKRASDEMDDSDDEVKGSAIDLGPTRKAHELLRELWRSTPSILQELIPQHLETELTAENVNLRLVAVETVADMISGIGHAGPPPPTALNPAAYPSQSLLGPADKKTEYNFLTTPSSPVSFISRYYQTYQVFVSRRGDPSPAIRAAWATAVGRILSTSAGGVGLDAEEEKKLLGYFSDSLLDLDERVRFNAVKAVERFNFDDIVEKLGSRGGVSDPGSILSNLAQRVKDKKQHVRNESIRLLAKLWGVAVGAIAEGSDRVSRLLGPIPSVILEAYYVNDPDINALVDRVLYESLLPLTYPPIKPKAQPAGNSRRVKDSQTISTDPSDVDPDHIRTERILLLIRDLEQRAKSVLFSIQIKQKEYGTIITGFLKACEDYNGGVMDKGEKDIKQQLTKFITFLAKQLPDSGKVSDDLWKFAKTHDRRSYQLIRFCMAPDSDYRKVQKSIRELTKRIEEAAGSTTSLLDTITILVFRCSNLLYNRSHVPAIIDFSRSDEKSLGSTAHEVLKEISKNKPEVFKAHVQDLCKSLEAESPTAKKPNGPNAVDDLKACAQFARQFPKDVPKERKFLQAMLGFVSYGAPPKAAKYGVLIIMTTADKKEMYAKDIFKQCTQGFTYGSGNYLARLAALSQLMLLGPQYLEEGETDIIVDIAINRVLTNPVATPEPDDLDPDWLDEPDDNCAAKIWALKILANRLRGYALDDPVIDDASKPVFQFLNTLVYVSLQFTLIAESSTPCYYEMCANRLLARSTVK